MKSALLLLFALLGAMLVACGGGDDHDSANDSATAAATAAAAVTAAAASDADSDDDDSQTDKVGGGIDFGDGTASVTIGDTQYDFDMTGDFTVCRDVFGIIQLAGPSADGRQIGINGLIPPLDWETFADGRYDPPELQVDDEEQDILWIASASYAEERGIDGSSQIDSYDLEGLSASGTATFVNGRLVDRGESPEPVSGTFQVSCSE